MMGAGVKAVVQPQSPAMNAITEAWKNKSIHWPYLLTAFNFLLLLLSLLFFGLSKNRETNPLPNNHTQAPVTEVPAVLAQFLKEAAEPEFRSSVTTESLQAKRTELVNLINGLSGKRRDELREEIQSANWMLEACEIVTAQVPDLFQDRLGQFASISLLTESKPEGVPNVLEDKLSERGKELASNLKPELEKLVSAFKQADLSFSEDTLRRASLVADALADQLDEAEQNLPNWVEAWQEWNNRVKQQSKSTEDAGTKADVTKTNQLLQEGALLEQELVILNFSVPQVLVESNNALRNRLAEAERKAANDYQLWALNEIQAIREMAGAKASARIVESLEAGKKDPTNAAQNAVYRQVLRDNPVFHAKLAELSKISIPDSSELTSDMAASISKALNGVLGWTGLDELSKCLNRDLLEQRLLKIDEALLRRPLDRLYVEVFDECWKYLEGSDHRIAVAKTAATIEKKSLIFPR
jgi:gas vesicle protein